MVLNEETTSALHLLLNAIGADLDRYSDVENPVCLAWALDNAGMLEKTLTQIVNDEKNCAGCKRGSHGAQCAWKSQDKCVDFDKWEPKPPKRTPTSYAEKLAKTFRVRLTKDGNDYIPKGTIGKIIPFELSRNGDIITGKFFPEESDGSYKSFGLVTWPKFESVGPNRPDQMADGETETYTEEMIRELLASKIRLNKLIFGISKALEPGNNRSYKNWTISDGIISSHWEESWSFGGHDEDSVEFPLEWLWSNWKAKVAEHHDKVEARKQERRVEAELQKEKAEQAEYQRLKEKYGEPEEKEGG